MQQPGILSLRLGVRSDESFLRASSAFVSALVTGHSCDDSVILMTNKPYDKDPCLMCRLKLGMSLSSTSWKL